MILEVAKALNLTAMALFAVAVVTGGATYAIAGFGFFGAAVAAAILERILDR